MLSKTSTNVLTESFQILGLNSEHASVYLSILENGASPASTIAKSCRLPRSSVYLLLEDLKKIGLVTNLEGETVRTYSPVSPERVKDLLEEKARMLRRVDLDLRTNFSVVETLFENHQPSLPNIGFYEGETGLKNVYRDGLWSGEILILRQGIFDSSAQLSSDPPYRSDFVCECDEREIPIREILEESPASRQYREHFTAARVAIVPSGNGRNSAHVDKHIYGEKIAYIFHDRLVAVIIEDATLADSERATFNTLWSAFAGK